MINQAKLPVNVDCLTPQARTVLQAMEAGGGLTAVDAFLNLDGMTSATLARRIVDLERAGYQVLRVRKSNPHTGKRYTEYQLMTNLSLLNLEILH